MESKNSDIKKNCRLHLISINFLKITVLFLVVIALLILIVVLATHNPSKPIPDFSANITSGRAPLTVSFTDLSLNNPYGWTWYFGDENVSAPWKEVNANAEWSARARHTCVVTPDGNLIIMGGSTTIGAGSYENDIWRSADYGTTWTLVNSNADWPGRVGHSSLAMKDGSIMVMGGFNPTADMNDVWQSRDEGVTWKQVNASAGWSSSDHCSVAMPDDSIVVMGGGNAIGDSTNDVWRSMDYGTTWTRVNESAGWDSRALFGCVATSDGTIIIMGGSGYENDYKNDVWKSKDGGRTWILVNANPPWTPRIYLRSVAMPDSSIVMIGGINNRGMLNDVWRSTDFGKTWNQLTANAEWSVRYFQTSVAMPDGSIILTGGAGYHNLTNDVWRLTSVGSWNNNPLHTYTVPGNYSVILDAYNAAGYNSTRKTGYITVT
ncbi:MAG: kelch repeat-containing protein [Methanoregula sp.]|jgi:hypothetical protein